jgi:hypothetical protein
MKRSDVINIIEMSLANLYMRDKRLLSINSKEESINFHLANYINRNLLHANVDDLNVDLEFDRHGGNIKKIRIRQRTHRIRPDAIFHQRGHDRKNILAVECKKGYTNAHDRAKIVALLQTPYRYRFGALISYFPERDYFRYFLYFRRGDTIDYILRNLSKEDFSVG